MGSWSDHYNSWKNYKSCKILIIRYEDMVNDEINTFAKVINYLGEIDDAEFNDEKLKKALKQTQFKELQKMEKKEGFKEKRVELVASNFYPIHKSSSPDNSNNSNVNLDMYQSEDDSNYNPEQLNSSVTVAENDDPIPF